MLQQLYIARRKRFDDIIASNIIIFIIISVGVVVAVDPDQVNRLFNQ